MSFGAACFPALCDGLQKSCPLFCLNHLDCVPGYVCVAGDCE